jgi:hypothetical protein
LRSRLTFSPEQCGMLVRERQLSQQSFFFLSLAFRIG